MMVRIQIFKKTSNIPDKSIWSEGSEDKVSMVRNSKENDMDVGQ